MNDTVKEFEDVENIEKKVIDQVMRENVPPPELK